MPVKVLIVEDETIVGLDLAMQLEDEGHECIGPAASPGKAISLIEKSPPDFAVLDVNLAGTSSVEVAEMLQAMNCPFVYVTGYGEKGLGDDMPPAPILAKPLQMERLKSLIGESIRHTH